MSKKKESDKLDEFDNEIEKFLKTDGDYKATTTFVKKHIANAYYGFLSDRVKVKVKSNGKLISYDINKDDPLALLRFYHQSQNQGELPENFDELILFLNSKKQGVAQQKVNPTDTIGFLKDKKGSLGDDDDDRWYFSFELPHDKREGKMTKKAKQGGKKRKRKKKKKAFPSRKKNNRKNRTKKKTLSK